MVSLYNLKRDKKEKRPCAVNFLKTKVLHLVNKIYIWLSMYGPRMKKREINWSNPLTMTNL